MSSSGHLVLAEALLPNLSQPGVLFEVTLHIGTLVAVCVYFWKDLVGMVLSLCDWGGYGSSGQSITYFRKEKACRVKEGKPAGLMSTAEWGKSAVNLLSC